MSDLTAAIDKVIKGRSREWERTLTAIWVTLIDDFGKEIAQDLGVSKSGAPSDTKWRFDPMSAAARSWMSKHGAEAIKTIIETNLDDVRKVILAGESEGLTMTEIGKSIKQFYSDRSSYKAMRVARTEVSAAAGFGQREAAKQSGVVEEKMWISSRDDRVRDSHNKIDGETMPLDEPYSNGLMYPGDPSGDPSESIQCRCVEKFLTSKGH
jgi:SPP1 gp7 family putative phage head morphogenesis protein